MTIFDSRQILMDSLSLLWVSHSWSKKFGFTMTRYLIYFQVSIKLYLDYFHHLLFTFNSHFQWSFQKSSSYFKNVEVRIGDDSVTSSTTYTAATTTNTRCAILNKAPPILSYHTFTCPPPGIQGQYITVLSSNTISAYEIEVFGKLYW